MKKEKDYQKQLKLADEAKTNFLRRMSHDIRTPINGIRGIIEIANHNKEDLEKQQEYRDKIKTASGYLLDLINNVLDMSKLESSDIKLEHKPFNIREILHKSNEIIIMQCNECGITYNIEEGRIDHSYLIGSPLHFQQVLMNIAGNAVKYNRENGSIFVRCTEISSDDKMAEFELVCRDTGIGMSEDFQKRIFEPFSQENENARTKYAGTGLGMAIAKELIELQGGSIELKSKEGDGTEFKIKISFEIDHLPVRKKNNQNKEKKTLEGTRILLTEDNDLNMEVAEFMLKNKGAEITKAWNGKEAVEIFKASQEGYFDVILMDIMMPVMGGLEAARNIRKLEREDASKVLIVAMTANAFQDDMEKSIEAGMDAHITKPLNMDELLDVVCK
ncbi:response regulator [Eubacterium sp. MSJ-13]|uniref:hybrid sensor histidine kinase/response regulator n=1 Tax=Eubacterium sp. MSJ-13 TaxID=2841513 RepID=UPI001C105108|nr:ATP-binding protein [Eubacterium sp. MSJ-13]MBU5478403.1 response regulator [Eubacterium sp. MSJ-13]